MSNNDDLELVAKFYGLKPDPEDVGFKYQVPHFIDGKNNPMVCGRDYCEWADSYTEPGDSIHGAGGYCLSISMLEFNTSWDWLKPVIDKIGQLDLDKEPLDGVSIYSNIQVVFDQVVMFIKEYNELNKAQ